MFDDNNECGLAAPAQGSDRNSRVDVSEFASDANLIGPVAMTRAVISRVLVPGAGGKLEACHRLQFYGRCA